MFRASAARVAAVAALVIGALLVVSAGLGGTASESQRAQKTASSPNRLAATRLSIGLRVTPRTATRGKTVTYLMRVSNVGSDPARLLRVCLQVPLRLVVLSTPRGFVSGGARLWCRRFASLPIGGTVTFRFGMRVSTTARGGVAVSTAYARATGMVSFVFAQARLTIGVLTGCPPRSAC